MDDVLREIVLAGGDEDLGAGDLVAAVVLADRLGAQQAEVGAAVRLGQVHGAGPRPFHHLRQVLGLDGVGAVGDERGDGALRQARIHGEGHVGRAEIFVDQLGHDRRQALAAELRRRRHADPAAFGELLVGVLEAGGRGDAAVGVARAAFLVADPVERGQHLFGELGRFAQHRLHDVGAGVGEARQVAVAVEPEDVVEQKQGIVDWRLIGRHRFSPRRARARQAVTGFATDGFRKRQGAGPKLPPGPTGAANHPHPAQIMTAPLYGRVKGRRPTRHGRIRL